MTKYKIIEHKERLQWTFNLKWQKTNDQVQWKLRATTVTTTRFSIFAHLF